ncbi:MAG: hypothetical protein ACQEUM_05730 [Pseudomonadota bacterium]
MTSYNPFEKSYRKSMFVYEEIEDKGKKLEEKILWHENNNFESLVEKKDNLLKRSSELSDEENALKYKREELERMMPLASSGFLISPFTLFSKTSREARRKSKELGFEISKIESRIKEKQDKRKSLRAIIINIDNQISNFESFDISAGKRKLADLKVEMDYAKRALVISNMQFRKAEEKLKPLVDRLENFEQELAGKEDEKMKLYNLKGRLEDAGNGYERKQVHEMIEEAFGHGSPSVVEKSIKNSISSLERSIKKLEGRIKKEAEAMLKHYDKIIVDGNNMCYEGREFVGISPILKFIEACDPAIDILVVFDSDIRGLLKSNSDGVRNRFGEHVDVHIVASKEKADETIISIAEQSEVNYILSNDRFIEYFDRDPVKNGRIIRHEILSSTLIVHDLDISVRF